MDDELSRKIEPGVCTTARRIEVLNILKEEGIPTVVWLTPLLPFINDAEENIFGILEACQKASVRGIMTFHSFGVTLRDGDRQYFYSQLDKNFRGFADSILKRMEMPMNCRFRVTGRFFRYLGKM